MYNKTTGVVIATFNGEKYIEEQLYSIINQTIKPDFIVVSDGGSSDSTIYKCNSILEKSNIKYVLLKSNKRLSVSENFNKALVLCNCDYIFFSDQDDYWIENKIEDTIKQIDIYNACLAFTNAYVVDENLNIDYKNELWKSVNYSIEKHVMSYSNNEYILFKELLKRNVVTGMTMCITSDLRNCILPLSLHSIHDKWIALIACTYGEVIAINSKSVLYRQHSCNVVGTKRDLIKSFRHRKKYVYNIIEENKMINDLQIQLNKIGIIDSFIQGELRQYKLHICNRIKFIYSEKNILSIFKQYKSYKKFENKYFQIMLKDIYTKFFNANRK